MIARAVSPAPRTAPPSSPSLVGNKRPQPHRFHLTTGRVLEGNLHRAPNARLADHLATVKGFISLTDAYCVETGERFPYLVVNQDHVLFVEEIVTAAEPAGATLRSSTLSVLGS